MNFVSLRYETENWKLPECRPFKNRIGFNFHTYSAVLLLKTAAQLRALKIISAKWESFGVKNRVNYMSFEGRITVRNQRNFLSDDHMSYIIEHDCILQTSNIICWIQFLVSSYFGDRKVHWLKFVTRNRWWLDMRKVMKRSSGWNGQNICLHRIYFGLESKWSSNTTCLVLWFVPKSKGSSCIEIRVLVWVTSLSSQNLRMMPF